MSYTIQLTDEQYEAFKRGESITLIPPQTVKSLTYKKDVKLLRFYDAMNKCTYSHKGHQGGFTFDNYEPYIGPWPEWATQALNTLE